jgi:hypothetical protein
MLVGYLLKSKTPDNFLNMLAFVIFAVFGVFTLRQGLLLMSDGSFLAETLVLPILIIVTILFAAICFLYYKKSRR